MSQHRPAIWDDMRDLATGPKWRRWLPVLAMLLSVAADGERNQSVSLRPSASCAAEKRAESALTAGWRRRLKGIPLHSKPWKQPQRGSRIVKDGDKSGVRATKGNA